MSKKSASELIREHLNALASKPQVAESTEETTKQVVKESAFHGNDKPYNGPPRFSVLDEEMQDTMDCIKKYDPETYARIMRWD
jgi:Arc/MetJ-type ribon-helix-helix transcriptional regulator